MKAIDKFIMILCTVFVLLISIAMIALPFKTFSSAEAAGYAQRLSGNYIVTLLGAVILAAALKALVFRSAAESSGIVSNMKNGDLKISDTAIIGIVNNSLKSFPGVRESQVKVGFSNEVIELNVKGEVTPDVSIPSLAEEMQLAIKEDVENYTGVSVGKVNVEISNFSSGARAVR